jgi:TonB-linked SusC/RagA family outer membrane protein
MTLFYGLLLQAACAGVLLANTGKAQSSKSIKEMPVELELRNEKLEAVFSRVEELTDLTFVYKKSALDQNIKITRKVQNTSLYDFLVYLSREADLSFQRVNDVVNVKKMPRNSDEVEELMFDREISGTVKDAETGEPLVGASVQVKETSIGAITDLDGHFRFSIPEEASQLLVSYIGFESVEVPINNQSSFDIALKANTRSLEEIVVTALGMAREKRELGYSVQEVKGDQLDQARETNLLSSLSGKIAGVNITGGSNALGGSVRIVIRGQTSLAGDNQPLFVVNGIPIDNSVVGSNQRGMNIDYGNAAGEINPNDIESMTVLKGPNAAALYGSRASNGVVLITTKSGKNANGLGVSFTSTTSFESALKLPEFQNKYGQGRGGVYNIGDGGRSWGPPLDGREMNVPVNTEYPPSVGEVVPWVPYPNAMKEFFQTEPARTLNNGVSITAGNDKGNFRLSYSNLDQTGLVPNTVLKRNTIALSGNYSLNDKLSVQTNVNYVNTNSPNRTVVGYGSESSVYTWLWEGRQVRTDKMRDYWFEGYEGLRPFTYNYSFNDNPYYTVYENLNAMYRNRLYGNIVANYDITPGLTFMVRSGLDYSNERRDSRRTFGSKSFANGMYRQEQEYFEERNSDFLLTYSKSLGSDFSIEISAGGNQMNQKRQSLSNQANQLNIPGVYNLGNSGIPVVVDQYDSKYRINSLYGFGHIGYRNALFLDVTARNDWSSTLPVTNNSYFYPSVSLSGVVTELLPAIESAALSFAKVRLSWAQVGNDTDPYRLRNVFNYNTPWQSLQAVTEPASIPNANLVPESINTFEAGTEFRLVNNRIGVDLAYYDTRAMNQILNIPIDQTSGYTSRYLNAGEIRSRGVEVVLTAKPLRPESAFQWDVSLNWSANRAKVVSLVDGIDTYSLGSRYVSVQARVGERMGDMYATGFKRDPEGNIIHVNGIPVETAQQIKVGNYNPDWISGLYNTFRYKGFSLGVLFDYHKGGDIFSYTLVRGNVAGQLVESLGGRENGYVGPGVIDNGDGTFRPNDVNVTAERYWGAYYNGETATMDATFLKLREMKFGYTVPNKLISKSPIRDLTVQFVGRNLALWTKVPHIDPDTSGFGSGGSFLPGIEDFPLPTPRSLGFNINFKL